VVGMVPSAEEALAKVGIRSAGTSTTWLAGAMDLKRQPEPRLLALVQSAIDGIYNDFIGLVAGARKLPRDKVQAVAQGRVWSGKDALPIALVDRLGGWNDAVAAAQKRAKLPEGSAPRLRWFEVQGGRLERWLQRFGFSAAQAAWVSGVAEAAAWTPGLPEDAGGAATAAAGFNPALAAALAEDLGWLAEVATRQRPFAAAAHCLCGAP